MRMPEHWWRDARYAARHPLVKRGGWVASASAVIFLAVMLGLWWPARSVHQDLVGRLSEARRALVQAQQAAEIARAYRLAQQGIPVLEKKLEATAGQAQLVEHLARLAQKRAVRILAQTHEEGKVRHAYVPMHIDLTLQGGYAAVRAFLRDLSGLPMWSEIEELRMERSREAPGLVRAQVRVITYRKAATSGRPPA